MYVPKQDKTIEFFREERRLVQENIGIKIKYGWALIAVISGLLMIITIPSEYRVTFEPADVYILALIFFGLSITCIIIPLFGAHYGSSFDFLNDDRCPSDNEILDVERSMLRRLLCKSQYISLLTGVGIFLAFDGILILVMASTVNRLSDWGILIMILSVMLMMGKFVNKRMFRIFQIDQYSVPGRDVGSFSHAILVYIREWSVQRNAGEAKPISDKLREFYYGFKASTLVFVVLLIDIYCCYLFDYISIRYFTYILFATNIGFCMKHCSVAVKDPMKPSEVRSCSKCNSEFYMMWFITSLLFLILVVSALLPWCLNGFSWVCVVDVDEIPLILLLSVISSFFVMCLFCHYIKNRLDWEEKFNDVKEVIDSARVIRSGIIIDNSDVAIVPIPIERIFDENYMGCATQFLLKEKARRHVERSVYLVLLKDECDKNIVIPGYSIRIMNRSRSDIWILDSDGEIHKLGFVSYSRLCRFHSVMVKYLMYSGYCLKGHHCYRVMSKLKVLLKN